MDQECLECGDIRIDLRRHSVTRAGVPIPLEPKTFDVLAFLLEHRDRLVTKEELLDAVWKDVFVTPNVLTRAIAQLRKALGDDAREPRFIETVARRGYRVVVPVRAVGAPEPDQDAPAAVARSADARTRWPRWISTRTIAAVTAAIVVALAWRAVPGTNDSRAQALAVQRLTRSGDVIDAVTSPDGRYVAYVRAAGGVQSLWVRQTAAANPVQLVAPRAVGYWGIEFSPDSSSVYFAVKGAPPEAEAAGALYALPMLPGPPPRRILAGIDSKVTFSPDGRRLAFYRLDPGTARTSSLVVADADGAHEQVLSSRRWPELFVPAFFAAPAWSPDGRHVAVSVQNQAAGTTSLHLVAVADGADTLLRAGLRGANHLAWLRDGSGVIFNGPAGLPGGGWQLWVQPLDGAPPRRLTADTADYRTVTLTADGRSAVAVATDLHVVLWSVPLDQEGAGARISSMRGDGMGGIAPLADRILFTAFDTGEPQIWSIRPDGSGRQQITAEGWSAWPSVSPDGETLYVVGARNGQTGIWAMRVDGTGERPVVRASGISSLAVAGEWLYYTAESGDASAWITAGQGSTWRVPTRGGDPELIVQGLGGATVSPDGRLLAGLWRGSAQDPYVIGVFDATGGDPLHQFSGGYTPGTGTRARWAPDGRSLLVTTAERMNVWRQPLTGGPLQRVTNFVDGSIFAFVLEPDGRGVMVARGPSIRDAFLVTGLER